MNKFSKQDEKAKKPNRLVYNKNITEGSITVNEKDK